MVKGSKNILYLKKNTNYNGKNVNTNVDTKLTWSFYLQKYFNAHYVQITKDKKDYDYISDLYLINR